jgi:hypothetical protein
MATSRTSSKQTSQGADVEGFIALLEHPHKAEIIALRKLILGVDKRIKEDIKWSAPSFYTTEHFATFHLRGKPGVHLMMHFGAKKNAISDTGVEMPDPQKLLHWLAKDRAVMKFESMKDVEAKRSALVALIREWIKFVE